MKQNNIKNIAGIKYVFPVLAVLSLPAGCGRAPVLCSTAETTDAASTDISAEAAWANPAGKEFYDIYEPYGVSFDEEKQELSFNGELVRCFRDGVVLEEGAAAFRCNYFNEKGCVDIRSVREPVPNGDGSFDPFGNLTGIEKSSREEFENRDLSEFYRSGIPEATTDTSFRLSDWLSGLFTRQKSISDIIKEYESFGLFYEKTDAGMGNIYYNGQLVNTFTDIKNDGGVFSFQSADKGQINVRTVYDDEGTLTGLTSSPMSPVPVSR